MLWPLCVHVDISTVYLMRGGRCRCRRISGSAPGRRCALKDARVSTKTSTQLNTKDIYLFFLGFKIEQQHEEFQKETWTRF